MAQIGDELGPYRLDAVIGRGGFATVFRATHAGLQIERAVKVLHSQHSDDDQIRELFQSEGRRAAQLSAESVVQVFDAGETAGEAWIATELMTGGTLADALEDGRRLTVPEVRALGADLAQALMDAHSRGVLHRDVKPANVFLKPDGGGKLGDFGVSGDLSGQTHASTMVGTLSYMAPEQDEGQTTEASDIYALGAVLFEAWTGTRAPSLARKPPTWPPATGSEWGLRNLIAAMLDEEPAGRPTATGARNALMNADAAEAATQVARRVATATPTSNRRRLTVFGIGVLAVVLAGVAIGGSMLTGDEGSSEAESTSAVSEPTSTATAEASAVAASGTNWLIQGFQVGTSARQDCDAFADTDGPSVPDKTEVTLELEGVGRCAGWYQVRAVNREFWVLSTHLSSSRPVVATPVPTAVATSGTRWIAKTGGVGVRSRQDCTESAATSGPTILEGVRVSLVLRGIARCNGWYQVSSAGRRAWVSLSFLSLNEPTPIPTRTPAPTTSPTPTPVATASKPEVLAMCNSDVSSPANASECLAAGSSGIRWGVQFSWWGRFDSDQENGFALDGDVVDWSDLPPLTPGWHTIQLWSPPGGDYEGWSDPFSFLVIE